MEEFKDIEVSEEIKDAVVQPLVPNTLVVEDALQLVAQMKWNAEVLKTLEELQKNHDLLRHKVYMLENKERILKSFAKNKKTGRYQERKQA